MSGAGDFWAGGADFRSLTPTYQPYDRAKFAIRVAGKHATYNLDGKVDPGGPHRWTHIALTGRRAQTGPESKRVTFTLWLDGERQAPDTCPAGCPLVAPAPEIVVPVADLKKIVGTVLLGRTSSNSKVDKISQSALQFYGLIDDVGAFSRPLGEEAIRDLAFGGGLTGKEQFFAAGITFSNGKKVPGKLRTKIQFISPAKKVAVADLRGNPASLAIHPGPDASLVAELRTAQDRLWKLPFAKGVAWQVIQGNSESASHNGGTAAFSWDFVRAFKPMPETCGQRVSAPAAGTVVDADDFGTKSAKKGLWPDGANILRIEHGATPAKSHRSTMLHLRTGSFSNSLAWETLSARGRTLWARRAQAARVRRDRIYVRGGSQRLQDRHAHSADRRRRVPRHLRRRDPRASTTGLKLAPIPRAMPSQ